MADMDRLYDSEDLRMFEEFAKTDDSKKQAPMTNEQAAEVLTKEADGWGNERVPFETYATALRMGATDLRGWVKTADRLPTEADGLTICVGENENGGTMKGGD